MLDPQAVEGSGLPATHSRDRATATPSGHHATMPGSFLRESAPAEQSLLFAGVRFRVYSAPMQYLAIRSDRHPTPEVWRKFVHKRDVPCPKCEVVYQLWAPLEPEQDDAAVKAQAAWLSGRLEEECPGHADWFHSPDN